MNQEPDLMTLLMRLQSLLEQQQQSLIERDVNGLKALTGQCTEVCRLTEARRVELSCILSEPAHPDRQKIIALGRACQRLQQRNREHLERLASYVDVLIVKPQIGTKVYQPEKVSREPFFRHLLLKV